MSDKSWIIGFASSNTRERTLTGGAVGYCGRFAGGRRAHNAAQIFANTELGADITNVCNAIDLPENFDSNPEIGESSGANTQMNWRKQRTEPDLQLFHKRTIRDAVPF